MSNTLPTVDIKGKEYVLVKDRILSFNDNYPNGSIETELVSPVDSKTIIVKAIVVPDVKNPTRRFVDYSQATIGQGMVNVTAALENASTSAVGRALAYMGIGVIESIASADEVVKATQHVQQPVQATTVTDKANCKHINYSIQTAGPSSSRAGDEYQKCRDCGEFIKWLPKDVVAKPENLPGQPA